MGKNMEKQIADEKKRVPLYLETSRTVAERGRMPLDQFVTMLQTAQPTELFCEGWNETPIYVLSLHDAMGCWVYSNGWADKSPRYWTWATLWTNLWNESRSLYFQIDGVPDPAVLWDDDKRRAKILCVDFDGTVVKHEYPAVGNDVPDAERVLTKLGMHGVRIILWTMRHGKELEDAVSWFTDRGIALYAVNENPEQREWTGSPKCYANHYVDDAAIGCPLIYDTPPRPWVDWEAVESKLIDLGYFG